MFCHEQRPQHLAAARAIQVRRLRRVRQLRQHARELMDRLLTSSISISISISNRRKTPAAEEAGGFRSVHRIVGLIWFG